MESNYGMDTSLELWNPALLPMDVITLIDPKGVYH
jgi:hypothetical protein